MKKTYTIMLLISILTLAICASASTVKKASAQNFAGPYYSVEPTVISPATAVGQNFTVTLKLNNVTTSNVPHGISGVEVHLLWDTTLVRPLHSTNDVGVAGNGVLNGPGILYGLTAGFYDNSSNLVSSAPYTNAVEYAVAAASTSGAWWINNATDHYGLVADVTFQVISQPTPFAICPIQFKQGAYLVDGLGSDVAHDYANATVVIKSTSTYDATVNFTGVGSYSISIASDSNVTVPANMGFQNTTGDGASLTFNAANYTNYDVFGFCNVTIPKNFMWSTPENNWTITVDNVSPQNVQIASDDTNIYLWFNFTAGSHTVMLGSTNVVPEFANTTLMLFLMATALIGVGLATNLRKRKFQR